MSKKQKKDDVEIFVTQNIIDASDLLVFDGDKEQELMASLTPIAMALNQQTSYSGWFVAHSTKNKKAEAICIHDKTRRFDLPAKAREWDFSHLKGQKVGPFSFYVPAMVNKIDGIDNVR